MQLSIALPLETFGFIIICIYHKPLWNNITYILKCTTSPEKTNTELHVVSLDQYMLPDGCGAEYVFTLYFTITMIF